jgi:hypothetical protein
MHIILYFYLFNYLLSSPCPSLDPSSVALEIYKREKSTAISYLRFKFGCREIFDHLINSALDQAVQNLLKLDAEELFKAMMQDESDYFVVIFWLICIRNFQIITTFRGTNTLYSLRFPKSEINHYNMKMIFGNFRKFVFQAFLSINALSWNESRSNELLSLAQIFWYNRLERLGDKVMQKDCLKEQQRKTERLFIFLYNIPIDRPKEVIVRGYRKLRQALKAVDDKTVKAAKDKALAIELFSLEVQYLWKALTMLPPSEFLKVLEWLSSRSPYFLAYFIYFFLSLHETQDIRILLLNTDNLPVIVKIMAQECSFWEKFSLIFTGRKYNSSSELFEVTSYYHTIAYKIWENLQPNLDVAIQNLLKLEAEKLFKSDDSG